MYSGRYRQKINMFTVLSGGYSYGLQIIAAMDLVHYRLYSGGPFNQHGINLR